MGDAYRQNVVMRDDDLEIVEDDPLTFVRQELEGFERGARREAAGTLVKAMMNHHEQQVVQYLSLAIESLLVESKDCTKPLKRRLLIRESATFLVISISIKASTRAHGVTEVYDSPQVTQFFKKELLPILQEDASGVKGSLFPEAALLKCTALRYLSLFRNFLPHE